LLSTNNVKRFNEETKKPKNQPNLIAQSGIKSGASSKMVSISVGQGKQQIALSHLNKKKLDK